MDSERGRRIYEDLGVNPVINAMGSQTVLGGSRLSPGCGRPWRMRTGTLWI